VLKSGGVVSLGAVFGRPHVRLGPWPPHAVHLFARISASVAAPAWESTTSSFLSLTSGVSSRAKWAACSSWFITGKNGLLVWCGEHWYMIVVCGSC